MPVWLSPAHLFRNVKVLGSETVAAGCLQLAILQSYFFLPTSQLFKNDAMTEAANPAHHNLFTIGRTLSGPRTIIY